MNQLPMQRIIPVEEHLLSIDWDFFFPEPHGEGRPMSMEELDVWDWEHSEQTMDGLSPVLWNIRAARFIMAGLRLPVHDEVLEKAVLRSIDLSKVRGFYLADSHAQAYNHPDVFHKYKSIVSLDAHHDLGYEAYDPTGHPGSLARCGDWLQHYWCKGVKEMVVVYPGWKKKAFELEPTTEVRLVPRMYWKNFANHCTIQPTRIFICKSGTWTPTWLDEAFERFCIRLLQRAERKQGRNFRPHLLEPQVGLRQFAYAHAEEVAKLLTSGKSQLLSSLESERRTKNQTTDGGQHANL